MTAGPKLRKRSFLELPISIDVEALTRDVCEIPGPTWKTPYWNAHGSSKMILLRGGNSGAEKDFWAQAVHDSPLLEQLAYIRSLIGRRGPFGEVRYAFLFQMRPLGISRQHWDRHPAWKELFRVHVPVETTPQSFLLSEGKAKHFAVGEVWTFHNQRTHSVINGDGFRTHLILDVAPTQTLERLVEQARFDPGVERPELWKKTLVPKEHRFRWPWDVGPLDAQTKRELDLSEQAFAGRIRRKKLTHVLQRDPLKKGDIIVSINGVSTDPVARTPEDYLGLKFRAGDEPSITVLRDDEVVEIPYLIQA